MSQPIRAWGSHLVFQIGPKNTNLVEDVEILLPVKFRWILLSGFRGEVKNVKVNDGQTDDGQRMITIVHLSLWLRCTKNLYSAERMWRQQKQRMTDGRTDLQTDGQQTKWSLCGTLLCLTGATKLWPDSYFLWHQQSKAARINHWFSCPSVCLSYAILLLEAWLCILRIISLWLHTNTF